MRFFSIAMLAALMGCTAPTTITTDTQKLASDVALLSSGLQSILPAVQTLANVPPATVAKLEDDLKLVEADAAAVQAAVASGTVPTTEVQAIASVVGDIANVILPAVPGGAIFVPVVAAAETLVPALLAAVGVSGDVAYATTFTPEQARLILAAAAQK